MEITYLDNAGFYIDVDDVTLVFDYYNQKSAGEHTLEGGIVTLEDIAKNKKTYVFCTHSHTDHYNSCVLQWQKQNANITYVFDSGIEKTDRNIVHMEQGDTFADDHVKVKAFGSTDIGISFLVKVKGKTLFHAGDLNFWHWEQEADEAFIEQANKDFTDQLDALMADEYNMDVMFFPCDYRMGDNGDLGAVRAIEAIKPSVFIPMHFKQQYDKIEAFKKKNENKDTKIWAIAKRGAALHLV